MKTRILSAAAIVMACSLPLAAQEPVIGVDDPESLFAGGTGEERVNKQAALHIMRELLQCNYWDRADEWLTDRYIQHNPNAESGRDGVVFYFTEVVGRE